MASGSCVCGKVSFTATMKEGVGVCHCGTCRKWSGGNMMSAHAQSDIEFKGQENIATYASSAWAERAFCKECGTNLYYRLLPNPQSPNGEYILSAGLLDDQANLVFDHEVYVDHNPGWYSFANEASRQRMTEEDVLAMYGAE